MKLTAHPLAEPLPADAARAAQTDQQVILRLRVSLARQLAKGNLLAKTFYALLFERHPELRRLFPAEMQQQEAKLLQTLAWLVTHLDRRDETIPAVRELGRRHASYGVTREHYPIVRDTLIDAMQKTAGRDWDDEIAQDWRVSLDLITRHMLTASAAADSGTILTTPR